jgi:hypothetical protein
MFSVLPHLFPFLLYWSLMQNWRHTLDS